MSFFTQWTGASIAHLYFNGVDSALTTLGLDQLTTSGGFNLHLGLFTAKPDDLGTLYPDECNQGNYEGYYRVPMNRSGSWTAGTEPTSAWTIATVGNTITVSNALAVNFPPCGTAAGAVVTHWGLFDDATAGHLLAYGALKASGASWRVGMYTDTATNYIYTSSAHGLSSADPVLVAEVYNEFASTIPSGGTAMTAGTIYYARDVGTADQFKLTDAAPAGVPNAALAFSNKGPFMFIKAAPVTIAANGIPSFSAGSLVAARIC